MLAEAGLSYVITGHSERRAAGESDKDVRDKASAALRSGLIPIICVGESLAQREAGEAMKIVSGQLAHSMPSNDGEAVIAYEPIWAIGTGKTPTMSDIAAMHDHIRAVAGEGIRLLYGGSVKPANAADILAIKNVNGALIGGASLEMDSLSQIAKAAL
jgi:triosephosphate isomerase